MKRGKWGENEGSEGRVRGKGGESEVRVRRKWGKVRGKWGESEGRVRGKWEEVRGKLGKVRGEKIYIVSSPQTKFKCEG